ncbi:hypothetical protein CX649_01310 [Bacillaceae bacterium ZC4]|nr:hypothetical protein CX649_01310 [Bacillaceae bacterium ZC4]
MQKPPRYSIPSIIRSCNRQKASASDIIFFLLLYFLDLSKYIAYVRIKIIFTDKFFSIIVNGLFLEGNVYFKQLLLK